jgi:hypothetical protein
VRLRQRFAFREYQKGLAGNQVLVPLSHQRTKNPLCPISPDRIAEAFPDDNSDAARRVIHPVHQQIKQSRGDSPSLTFDGFNIPAGP